MSTPAVKRRRIDVATSTLSKPFRSPLKSPLKAQDSTSDGTTLPSSPAPLETSAFIPSEKTPSIDSPIVTPRRILGNKNTLSPPLSTTVKLNTDPEIAQMLRTQRDFEKQLRDVKEQLETAKQAAKIERESRKTNAEGEIDGELEVLIEKWMGASRQAAEELFGKVRDRVNRMGGPRAWKEMQKKQHEFYNAWNQEDQASNYSHETDKEDNDVEKRDLYAEYGFDEETEVEKSQRANGIGDTGQMPGQEDEFTMAMMLRTLNVDLDIIGYDKEQQRWKD